MVQGCWAEGPQALDLRFAFGSLASTLASRAREPQTPRATTVNPKIQPCRFNQLEVGVKSCTLKMIYSQHGHIST